MDIRFITDMCRIYSSNLFINVTILNKRILSLLKQKAGDEFYDYRCICICPSFTVIGEADTNRKIYIDVLNKDSWYLDICQYCSYN